MSDFDKEKERQRLREKYEQDAEKRDSTQRMSELLLKGATMTNKHCPRCGDPLFRYNGQEFCPSCQTGSQQAKTADGDAANAAEANAAATKEVAQEGVSEGKSVPPQAVERTESTESEISPETIGDAQSTPAQQHRVQQQPGQQPSQQPNQQPNQRQRIGDASLRGARESLVETLTWAANEAAQTDDPHRAKEYLAAAREAAEAIAALDR